MTKQWDNMFNPFNSWKVMFHSDRILKMLKWYDAPKMHKLPPPVSVTIDPTNKCNQNCIWCLYKDWRTKPQNQEDIDIQEFVDLVYFLEEWGVKSICVAGGGEPFLYPEISTLLEAIFKTDMDLGVITNGSLMKEEDIITLAAKASFVGFSVDAGNKETYDKLHRPQNNTAMNTMFSNMGKLNKLINEVGSKTRIGMKYLLCEQNSDYSNIADAFSNAVRYGVKDLHFRVAYFKNAKHSDQIVQAFDTINDLRDCYEDINVYGITHKYSEDFTTPRKNFKDCLATPLALTFGGDGNMWICCDTRGWKGRSLGKWTGDSKTEILNKWGSMYHYEKISKICVQDCPRCTFSFYNELIEKAFFEDSMNRNLI